MYLKRISQARTSQMTEQELADCLEGCELQRQQDYIDYKGIMLLDGKDSVFCQIERAIRFICGFSYPHGFMPCNHPAWYLWIRVLEERGNWKIRFREEPETGYTLVHLGDFLEWARGIVPDVIDKFHPAPILTIPQPSATVEHTPQDTDQLLASNPAPEHDWRNDPTLLKRDKQDRAILEVIAMKGWNPMTIPDGEKGTIETLCRLEYPELFAAETSFDQRWRKGVGTHWRMQNHASYSRRGEV